MCWKTTKKTDHRDVVIEAESYIAFWDRLVIRRCAAARSAASISGHKSATKRQLVRHACAIVISGLENRCTAPSPPEYIGLLYWSYRSDKCLIKATQSIQTNSLRAADKCQQTSETIISLLDQTRLL